MPALPRSPIPELCAHARALFSALGRPRRGPGSFAAARAAFQLPRTRAAAPKSARPEDPAEAALEMCAVYAAIAARRQVSGAVMTPPELARGLVRRLIKDRPDGRVLDPAAGGGIFLVLTAIERLAAGADPTTTLGERVFGVDCDPAAVAAARLALALLAPGAEEGIAAHVLLGDSLEPQGLTCALLARPYELVLCNPPWVSLSGRHSARASLAAPAPTREEAARGAGERVWPSLQSAFIDLAAARVAPGGALGLVLPSSTLELPGYQSARRAVEARLGAPVWLDDAGEDAFPGVVAPVSLLAFVEGRGAAARARPLWRRRAPLLERLNAALGPRPTFPKEAFGDPGVHTGNAADLVLLDRRGAAERACREGRCLKPYVLSPARRWLRARPRLPPDRYWRCGPRDRYTAAPILLRQTADRPIAARHVEPTYFRNSLLACYGCPGMSIELLLAILNSDLAAVLHRLRHRDGRQRAFPQVKVGHLRALPLPRLEGARSGAEDGGGGLEKRIRRLVRRRERAPDSPGDELEAAVCRLYELDASWLEEIQEAARSAAPARRNGTTL